MVSVWVSCIFSDMDTLLKYSNLILDDVSLWKQNFVFFTRKTRIWNKWTWIKEERALTKRWMFYTSLSLATIPVCRPLLSNFLPSSTCAMVCGAVGTDVFSKSQNLQMTLNLKNIMIHVNFCYHTIMWIVNKFSFSRIIIYV